MSQRKKGNRLMPRYEYVNPAENANKFYEIERRGPTPSQRYEVIVRWGRIGATPTSKIHSFGSDYMARDKYNELIRQKTAKGYRLVTLPEVKQTTYTEPIVTKKKEPEEKPVNFRIANVLEGILGDK
jgi:predicted DNA-binding WGR domain protein